MVMKRTPVCTQDGSYTFQIEALGECYHSLCGAVREAREVYLQAGLEHYISLHPQTDRIRIFEMGFGTGLNAWLTLRYVEERQIAVEYWAIEKYPLTFREVAQLNYSREEAFYRLHHAPWGASFSLSHHFTLCKQQADLLTCSPPDHIDLVYFDAFAPNIQPDLWRTEVFASLYRHMNPGALLVTYSAKGSVKEALRCAGFGLQRLKGSGNKRHMLRACKAQEENEKNAILLPK